MTTIHLEPRTKHCPDCGEHKSVSAFAKNRTKYDGLQTYCRECAYRRMRNRPDSLDRAVGNRFSGNRLRTLYDITPAPILQTDETYEKVFRALAWWIRKRILTARQAEAIYLHAVEMFSLVEIGKMVGVSHTTVKWHYDRGIGRLREYYADMADAI